MASFQNARLLMERLYKCAKGNSKSDYREFTTTCIQLARMIDMAVAKNQKLSIVQGITQLLKKVCEQKDNEMFQPAIMVLLMSVKNAICFNWFTPAEGQDLLRMSKELVDFFTGVGGWSAIDSNEASQFICSIIPRFYPLLNLQTVIVALEAKAGYEAMVCDFYVLKKPSPAEELRMFVVRKDTQETSSCLVTPSHVNFMVNGKGVEKRSLTSLDTGPQMPSNVTGMLKIGTNLLQIVGEFPGNYLIAIALTTTTTEFSSPLNLQIYNHAGLKLQTDEELVEGASRVSLLCPISHKRITSPVKGSLCKHHQCFDYNSFMEINTKRPAWRCPYCNCPLCFTDLRLDLQMLKILKETEGDTVDVMVNEDGSWETLKEDVLHYGNLASKKRENHSANSSVEEGEILLEKKDAMYVDLSDTEEQRLEHCDRVSSLAGRGNQSADTEDRKPDITELNAAVCSNSSHGQIDVRDPSVIVSNSETNRVQLGNTCGVTVPLTSEGTQYSGLDVLLERQANTRSPIAVQALSAQIANANSSVHVCTRTTSDPSLQAQTVGSLSQVTSCSNLTLGPTQRPLQVQLPSFVGIQDGQVLINSVQHQHLPPEFDENLSNSQLQQGMDVRDAWQRSATQHHVQRPSTNQPVNRVSRDHPYYPAASRSMNQVRTTDRQVGHQQPSFQQSARTESLNPLDNQILRLMQAQIQQPTQQQTLLNIGSYPISNQREENTSAVFTGVAPGILRRQTSQNPRTNPLIVANTSSSRDQRWANCSDGLVGQVSSDISNAVLPDQPRPLVRMRGSIINNGSWPHSAPLHSSISHIASINNSSHMSRFSLPSCNNDLLRQMDPPRPGTEVNVNLQSIQTSSTLVTDFDNWLVGDMEI